MTYESAEEAEVLKSYWRSSELENTVFAILDPNGRPLTRTSRGPRMLFNDASDMASYMNNLARYYRGASKPQELPVVDTVRLGLNVAACDSRPLAIVVGESEQTKKVLESRLASIAWTDDFIGKLIYTSGSLDELKGISGLRPSARGYLFVKPNIFGNKGQVLVQLGAQATQGDLKSAVKKVIATPFPQKVSHRQHASEGYRQGIEWQTQIPVTDRHAVNARGLSRSSGPSGRRGGGARPYPQRRNFRNSNYSSSTVDRSKYIYTR